MGGGGEACDGCAYACPFERLSIIADGSDVPCADVPCGVPDVCVWGGVPVRQVLLDSFMTGQCRGAFPALSDSGVIMHDEFPAERFPQWRRA
jgi:hypothetical protein